MNTRQFVFRQVVGRNIANPSTVIAAPVPTSIQYLESFVAAYDFCPRPDSTHASGANTNSARAIAIFRYGSSRGGTVVACVQPLQKFRVNARPMLWEKT